MAEGRDITVERFVKAANEVTIGGFWMEHAKDELKTRKDQEIMRFLSPCWEKKFLNKVFYAGDTIFEAFAQALEYAHQPPAGLLSGIPQVPVQYGPAYIFSRGMGMLQIDGYLTLVLLTHGELTAFHRLMKYREPLSVRKAHLCIETYSYKCAA